MPLCINSCPEAPPSCRLHLCAARAAEPPGASGPALAHRCRNRGWGLGQKCSFIYLCTAAFCPAAKAAVPATVQITSCGCSPCTFASASAQQELVVAGRSYVPSEGAGAHANELLIFNFQLVDQAAFLMPVWQLIVLPLHLKQNKKKSPAALLPMYHGNLASVFQSVTPRELSMITLINACGAQPIVNMRAWSSGGSYDVVCTLIGHNSLFRLKHR